MLTSRAREFQISIGAIAVGCAVLGIHAATLQHSALSELKDTKTPITITAIVTSEPHLTKPRVNGSRLRNSQWSFLVRTEEISTHDSRVKLRLPLRILSTHNPGLIPGQRIEMTGRLISTPEKRVAATLVTTEKIVIVTDAKVFSRALAQVRSSFRIKAQHFGDDAGALIPGMIIGDTSLQSQEFSDHMRRAGLSHLTAVSGANFAIVSSLVFFLFRRIIPTIVPRIIVTSIALTVFLLLVRPSPSVLRAGVMAAVILLARATGNLRNSVSALAAAISLLVLIDPFQALDPGFILSVLATSGLIFLAPLLSRSLQRYLPETLAELCAVPCAATLMCTPYLIYLTGEVSLFSVLFNVAVSPLVAPITILGFLSLITLPMSVVSSLALGLAHFLAKWITTIALWSQVSPSLRLNLWLLLVLAIVLWFVKVRFSLIFAGVFGALFFIALILPSFYFPGKNWKVVQCDVGQGDALVINLGSGSGILFDAGPEPQLITKCLKRIGIKRLPLVVISHGHADHYYGAQGLSKKFEIGEMWSNGNIGISEISEFATRTVHRGMRANISDVSLAVLWPTSATQSFSTLQGDGSAENNKSVVILVRWSGVRILVTGDIEPEVQSILARDYELSDIEVLKVPHHGSRFQDSNFLREVSPSIALISVGRGNSYGHPDAETLEKLGSQGAALFRTDFSGPVSVAWRFDDSAARYIFTTRVMRKEWWRLQWH